VNDLINRLTSLHRREYAYLTGNATTALYCALKSLGLSNARIAISNSCCFNVVLSILLSGNEPVFLDISKKTLGLCADALRAESKRIDAVVAIHGYGSVCDITEIDRFCKEKGIFLVEDAAVAQGAVIDQKPVGAFGDISIISFGAGKIIDAGHGGVVLCNDSRLGGEVKELISRLSAATTDNLNELSAFRKYFIELYNYHYTNTLNSCWREFRDKALSVGKSFLCAFDEKYKSVIDFKIQRLKENVALRRANAERLKEYLTGIDAEIFMPCEGSVYWRFNLFIRDRNRILRELLARGYKCSSWYPSVDTLFRSRDDNPSETPMSDWVGDHILNIWINDEIDDKYLSVIAQEIQSIQANHTHN
jgi:dTDP-4-amino-4,6-dideoxygalactose transaminase